MMKTSTHPRLSGTQNLALATLRRAWRKILQALVATQLLALSYHAAADQPLQIGTGMYDITGPAAEAGMMGYAALQTVDGIKQRLWARAFIMVDPVSQKRVVFVSCDLGAIFQSEKLAVIDQLKQRFGSLYDASNVMISATHTHVGSGGQSHYELYLLAATDNSGFGYNNQAYQAVVRGIVEAISRAHENLAPGSVRLASDTVSNISLNRAQVPYNANHDANQYSTNYNNTMTVLKFINANGAPVGMVNWYPVHATSFSNKYTKLSGDSKGYASHEFEKWMQGNPLSPQTFVAAFAQSDEGDVVPVDGNANSSPGFMGSPDEETNVLAAGNKQLIKGQQIYQMPGKNIGSSIDYRHQWINFPQYVVSGAYTGNGDQQLCTAAIGPSFVPGGPNGPSGVPGFYPGMTASSIDLQAVLKGFLGTSLGSLGLSVSSSLSIPTTDPCQAPKPVLLPTGVLNWTPQILPVQLFRIGSLAIIGVPFEVTTMVGRHLRARVLQQFAPLGVTDVVIAGLSNSYAGYTATYDEYQMQYYEGASTHFGPNQAAALEQMLGTQASAMVTGASLADTGTPPTVAEEGGLLLERPGVIFDDKNAWESFGQVLTDANLNYSRGATVTVTFRGGHPKNNLHTMDTFLKVQRQDPNSGYWNTVATDNDFEATYQWQRAGVAMSVVTVTWKIPQSAQPGAYRIVQQGDWKNGLDQSINPYTGTSSTFQVF